jgi:phosphoribosylaminoimidazole-succinocarboxamide synthase
MPDTGVVSDSEGMPGWTHVYSGKVRDLYVPTNVLDDDDSWTGDPLSMSRILLVVASDRVSAYDTVLEPAIPGKGAMLTKLTRWWFDQLPEVPNHLAYAEDDRLDLPAIPAEVADRATLCRTLDMFPIECVVRGFITGGGWNEYQATGAIGGIPLREGLENGDRLPEPIYTPAGKAPMGEHDENISYERTVELVGETVAAQLRELSPRPAASSSPTRSSSSAPTATPASSPSPTRC